MVMKASEILEAARQEIEERWVKGSYFQDTDGRDIPLKTAAGMYDSKVCSIGAIQKVSFRKLSTKSRNRAECFLAHQINPDLKNLRRDEIEDIIIWFNDEDDRTKEEVLEKFDAAIVAAKEAEKCHEDKRDPGAG